MSIDYSLEAMLYFGEKSNDADEGYEVILGGA